MFIKISRIVVLMILVAMMLVVIVPPMAFAAGEDQITVNKDDLPPNLVKQLEAKQQVDSTIETVGKYAGLGKEIGQGFNGALSALTDNAAKFADTKAGRFTMFIVAYKVIGQEALRFIIGIFLLPVGIMLFVWSYRANCLARSVLESEVVMGDKTERTYTVVHENDTDDIQISQIVHVVILILWVIGSAVIMFG